MVTGIFEYLGARPVYMSSSISEHSHQPIELVKTDAGQVRELHSSAWWDEAGKISI